MVEVNATESLIFQVKFGASQGSLRGLSLLPIYVNNFPECVSESEVHLYADDTIPYVIGDSVDEVTLKYNQMLNEICA